MTATTLAKTSFHPLPVARALLIGCALALLISPPLTNLLQALLLLVVLASGELRGRLWRSLREPIVIGALAFYGMLTIAAAYSAAPPAEAFGMLSGWRKLLLVPFAVALFDDGAAKRRLVLVFVAVTSVFAVISYYSLATGTMPIPVRQGEFPGTVVRNHATQGMMFAVAGFAAVVLALQGGWRAAVRWRVALAICALLLIANVIFVSTGRSGYVVLLACAATGAVAYLWSARGRRVRAMVVSGVGMALLATLLYASPNSREGIARGVQESRNYHQQEELTSMGIRQYFWRNTLALIAERPVFGYGTASFEHVYGKLVAGRPGFAGTPSSDPHQQFLKIATEQGVVGLALFLAFLLAATRQRAAMPWRLLGLGALAGWCLTSLANSHFSTFAEGTFIYLWIGAMLAPEREPRPGVSAAPPT